MKIEKDIKVIFKPLVHITRYYKLVIASLLPPQNSKLFYERLKEETNGLILNSIFIVVISSAFVGAILTIQTAFNLSNPLVPRTTISFATRQVSILEFGPTIISVVLAGKLGSNIATQIASMKVTEQITALRIMGINPESYIILPKIVVLVLLNPVLIAISMIVCIIGGYLGGVISGVISGVDYINGLYEDFNPYILFYSFFKTMVFAFIIATVSSYFGYITDEKGGAKEVGKSGTKAVVMSNIFIFISNLVITDLILA